MRGKNLSVTGMIGLAALVLGLAATASVAAQEAKPAAATAGQENLHLVLRDGHETQVDVRQNGFGAGDYAVKTSSIYAGTERLGRLTQICTLMSLKPAPSLSCSVDLVLSEGQVTLQGSFTLADKAPQLAVTGGTGHYQGVYGQLTETGSQGDNPLVTLHLVYPSLLR